MLSNDLKSKIKWLWDRFWAGGLSNPITAIEQISYLLFMRRLEYVDNGRLLKKNEKIKWSYYTKAYKLTESELKKYQKDKELLSQKIQEKDNGLFEHIKDVVFPYIKNLNDPHEPFTRAMESAVFLIEKPSLLREAIETIDDIYSHIEREQEQGQYFQDTQGDLYEYLLEATSQAGKNGQFRTPRHIIQMMSEILEPNVEDTICDLTSGTAGFLVGAYQYILTNGSSKRIKDENGFERSVAGDKLTSKQKKKLRESTFFGFDIDQTMVRIGVMNLIMHGITEPKIILKDTLSKDYDKFEVDEKYSVILANPPFTGRIDKNGLSSKLKRVETSQSELLFLDRIVHMLKPGGKAAVIIPEGVLFGSGKAQKKIRDILLKDCALDAVISLPSGVFQPYTGVKTSILVFTKVRLNSEVYNTEKVWFYGMDSDGYSLDTNRKKLNEKPLPVMVKNWQKRETSRQTDLSKNHFYVSIDQIIKSGLQLSYNQYRAFDYKEQQYESPKDLLARLIETEKEILNDMEVLNALI
jgi:type I restriction enzyme M protein